MKMSKLRAIAERLRSDYENERQSAVNLIEKQTGLKIADIIRAGAIARLNGTPQRWILDHLDTKTGDRLIVAVSREISALSASWGDIVEAGSAQKAKPEAFSTKSQTKDPRTSDYPHPEFTETWNSVFADFMEKAGTRMWEHAYTDGIIDEDDMQGIYDSVQRGRKEAMQKATRVGREDLPEQATGTPRIKRKGTTKDGKAYAVVSFHRMVAFGGSPIAPLCDFIAFGKDWTETIEKAANKEETVSVYFGSDRSPNKNVVITNAI